MERYVIFYPAGYLQLQVEDAGEMFCHIYGNPLHLAKDVSSLMDGDNTIGWYGDDPDAWIDVDTATASGCRLIAIPELPAYLQAFESGEIDHATLWRHEIAFYEALLAQRKCLLSDSKG